jgi:hypothetical protein
MPCVRLRICSVACGNGGAPWYCSPAVPLSPCELWEQIVAGALHGGIMARIWNTPFFILATIYFVVDGVFSYVTQPVSAWIAKMKPFERARIWVSSLRPYPSLALFRRPGHSPGAGQAFRGVFDRHRSFLRRCRYFHHGGSIEADLR